MIGKGQTQKRLHWGHPEVVAAARNEGPVAAVSLRRGSGSCQLLTVTSYQPIFEFALDG